MLERFRAAKRPEIDRLQALGSKGALPAPLAGVRPSFSGALRRGQPAGTGEAAGLAVAQAAGAPRTPSMAIIAEYKRASPSRGLIEGSVTPENAAQAYARGGATAISVLTEELHFRGELGFLARMTAPGLPLLRKDFIMHPLQVVATAATPASAMLLIVRLTPDPAMLRDLREQAEAHGIEAVVEIFDEAELAIARASGARIIQVNARDLDTLKTDRTATLRLGPQRDAAETWIAASGISAPEHLAAAQDAGYDAALVGTALMQGGDLEGALQNLLGRVQP